MLERVVSGGQTGADLGGWRAARAAGIPTGGWMPLGFLTETPDGEGSEPHPEFAESFGAREIPTAAHAARTFANALDSDGTLWFGDYHSTGGRTTLDACRIQGKPFLLVFGSITRPSPVAAWVGQMGIRVLNVAGNRESEAPGIGDRVERFLILVFRRLAEEGMIATREG